jgi:hypothetical protein
MSQWIANAVAVALITVVGASTPLLAQDRADMDRTRITGNRELPKVLYIVPWKKPLPGDLAGRPLVSELDEALAPIDRDVVRREVRYDALVRARSRTAQAGVAVPPVSPVQ